MVAKQIFDQMRILLRPAMIFIPIICAFLYPQGAAFFGDSKTVIRNLLVLMIFITCLKLKMRDLSFRKEHWIILLLNVMIGVIPFFLARILFPQEMVYALALFFTGITPTAVAASVIMTFLNGRAGFVMSSYILTNTLIPLLLIVLLPCVTGNMTFDFFFDVMKTLFVVIVIPFAVSRCVLFVYRGAAQLAGKLKMLSFCIWTFMIYVLSSSVILFFRRSQDASFRQTIMIAVLSLLLCILNFYLGGKISRYRLCRECSQALGQKNTSFTVYLALQYATVPVALGPFFYIFWHNICNAVQMYRYDRRRIKKGKS